MTIFHIVIRQFCGEISISTNDAEKELRGGKISCRFKVFKDFNDLKDFMRFATKIMLCKAMIIRLLQIKR